MISTSYQSAVDALHKAEARVEAEKSKIYEQQLRDRLELRRRLSAAQTMIGWTITQLCYRTSIDAACLRVMMTRTSPPVELVEYVEAVAAAVLAVEAPVLHVKRYVRM